MTAKRKKIPAAVRKAVLSEIGRRGGRIGGRRSLETMTPEARAERARRASMARWAKAKRAARRKEK